MHSINIWPDDLAFRICLGNLSSGSTRRAIKEKRLINAPSSIQCMYFHKTHFRISCVHILAEQNNTRSFIQSTFITILPGNIVTGLQQRIVHV